LRDVKNVASEKVNQAKDYASEKAGDAKRFVNRAKD
jgi:hypothetical protein